MVALHKRQGTAVGLMLLAAGNSSRMGCPKLLLRYGDCSLICRSLQAAIESFCQPVTVVLGAYDEAIELEIDSLPVWTLYNPGWQEGIASSIRVGIQFFSTSSVDAVIIMLCDQPYVSTCLINQLIKTYCSSEAFIVASGYEDTFGVPALFDRRYFSKLMDLKSNAGAKQLMHRYSTDLEVVNFPEGKIDLDTPSTISSFWLFGAAI